MPGDAAKNQSYISKRRKLKGLFFESALPNEYLVQIGAKRVRASLGGRRFSLFKKFLRIPASIQTLEFSTDNANIHFQGLGIEGYASWQINPANPEKAIESLDLFDSDDPMARTNSDLKLICIEAVRHVIANMTIEDAHRKKNDIALALKEELGSIEEKWGIVFHQVGIKKVTVMSENLFNDMQADYRNTMRLQSEKKRIETDTQIASKENVRFELDRREKLESEKRIQDIDLANDTSIKEQKIQQKQIIAQKEYELEVARKNLDIKLNRDQELALLDILKKVEDSRKAIALVQNETNTIQRQHEQTYSAEYLMNKLINQLPEIAGNLDIENYSVFDSNGEGVSPVLKIAQEFLALLKANQILKPESSPDK